MKNKNGHSFIIILVTIIVFASCKKHKTVNPIDQLPPETQTGANKFGCLVDGKAFLPGGAAFSGGSLQCNYQFDNGFYFILIGRYQNLRNGIGNGSVGLFTDSLKIEEGKRIPLGVRMNGNASGARRKDTSSYQAEEFDTNGNLYTGELYIKKLDTIHQIVSGTFFFDAVNSNGLKSEIRDGRFDVRYTR